MATTNHTNDAASRQTDGVTRTWAAIPNGNNGDAIAGPWDSAWFTATGTWGVSGSVVMQGSNDGVNWFNLSAAALTAAGTFLLGAVERPKYVRPSVTAGDGTTAITVIGFFKSRLGLY